VHVFSLGVPMVSVPMVNYKQALDVIYLKMKCVKLAVRWLKQVYMWYEHLIHVYNIGTLSQLVIMDIPELF